MKGTRLPDETDWASSLAPGSYWKRGGTWWGITPNGHFGDLRAHDVTEHEDGTITVSPSILVTTGVRIEREAWHGYLERGVWRSV